MCIETISNRLNTCFEPVMQSKLTDVILLAGCIAFTILALLGTFGYYHAIGMSAAHGLTGAFYCGAALLLVAQVVKLVINSLAEWRKVREAPTVRQAESLSREQIPSAKDWNEQQKTFIDNLVKQISRGGADKIAMGGNPPNCFQVRISRTFCFKADTAAIKETGEQIKEAIDKYTRSDGYVYVQTPINGALFDLDDPASVLQVKLFYLDEQ